MNNNLLSTRSSTAITGFATVLTNVYHGPDSNVYASVGSIGPLETVNILATSKGWYHIEYSVGNTNQRKAGYVPQSSLTNISGGTPTEEDFYGGYCYASTELDVRTCDDFSRTAAVGTLGQYEGCTFLFSYMVGSSNIAFIEYSTANGTKRGYVYSNYLVFPYETIVCVANEELIVYSGPSTSHAQLGTIYTNELMSLLAKEGNMIYVEYNTTGGRKRGYVDWTKVDPRDFTPGTVFRDFYRTTQSGNINQGAWVSSRQVVYGGPNTTYANTGVVNCEDIIDYNTENSPQFPLTYIEYYITGSTQKKCGYIDPSSIDTSVPMEHNTLTQLNDSYSYFGNKIYYGKSQLNRDTHYYKAGTGPNHLFLVFAQHGWEDGTKSDGNFYHGDGNMLVRIAKNFIERFTSNTELDESTRNTILQNWTIFVFPCNNPDGIVNGNQNYGFGRCLYNGIDPNRSWPTSFPSNTARDTAAQRRQYTSDTALNGSELQNLYNTLRENIGSGKNVLIDIHGWLNETIGNDTIGTIYRNQFGMSTHVPSYGSGYLINWARQPISISNETTNNKPGLGADSMLLELPSTNNYEVDKIEGDYGNKFFQATKTLLTTYLNN